MNIISDSRKVLNSIYNLLKGDSYTLVVNIWMEKMAKELHMSKQHLNLCIHYLIVSGYITGDFTYSTQENYSKEVAFTAKGIEKIENVVL